MSTTTTSRSRVLAPIVRWVWLGTFVGLCALAACESDSEETTPPPTTSVGAGGSGAGGGAGTGGAVGGHAAGGNGTAGHAGGAGAAGPTQLVVLDVTYEHNTDTMAFSFFEVPSHVPDDLTSPVDYAGGHLHQRVEVFTKPSNLGVRYQMCFFQDEHVSDKHACTSYLAFSEPGVVAGDQDMSSLWQYGVIDWTRALLDLMLVVKDADGNPVDTRYGFDGQWAGSPDLSLYYPMQVRYTAVIVPVGAVFEGFPP